MRKIAVLMISVWLVAGCLTLSSMPGVKSDSYGNYPPPADDDWVITVDTYVGNETLNIEKNITITSGATLVLQNVTLLMNSFTSTGDSNKIEVRSGGTLIIRDGDGDNKTTMDASKIMRNDPNYGYLFQALSGSRLRIYNSIIEGCGRLSFPGWQRAGFSVQTDDAIIDHNLITNAAEYGLVLYGSDAVVSNNTIEWCDTGIMATAWSNGTIENNVIRQSKTYGICIDGWDNVKRWSSDPLVKNNTIMDTGRGTFTAVGIQITNYCSPLVIDNKIIDYTEDAIYFGEWCQAVVENLTVEAGGGNYGLASSSSRNITVTNTTINNTFMWDLSLATAYYRMTNSSFNTSKVIFQGTDSNLTVNWYLNTRVVDSSGGPLAGATVRIRDNANGTYDRNFTTDANGYVNWTVLREYFQKDNNGDKDGDDPGERIDYGPYNVTVSKPGYSDTGTEVRMDGNREIILTLVPAVPAQANLTLSYGWNLISFPVESPELNGTPIIRASDLYNATNCTELARWDPVMQNYTIYIPGFHVPTDPENFIIGEDDAVFLWWNFTWNGTFNLTGYEPGPRNVHLLPGWNMIAYKSLTVDAVSLWAGQVSAGDYDDICWYDAHTFRHYIFPGTEMTLVPGRGYFVWSDNESWLSY